MDEIYIAYVGLVTLATGVIYAGAWGTLRPRRKSVSMPNKEVDEEEEEDLDERLTSSDAYWFPILASAALVGLYLVFKYLGTEWVNWLLGWYFAVMGVGSVWKTSTSLLRGILGREKWMSFDKTKLLIVKGKRELLSLSFRTPTAFILPFSLLPSVIYMVSNNPKPALLTNVLGLSFAYNALCLLKLDSFQTGTILLGGLFIYDIWWVFGTEVMVKVATTLDAPIKILWPKAGNFSSSNGFAMLGLGDIVVPGTFITLALRRDLWASPTGNPNIPFAKPYFTATLSAYTLGLVATVIVMHTFKAAQPALLYLSPACTLSFAITAVLRGELKQVWLWKDENEKNKETLELSELNVREPITEPNGAVTPPPIDVIGSSAANKEPATEASDEGDQEEGKPKKRRTGRKKR